MKKILFLLPLCCCLYIADSLARTDTRAQTKSNSANLLTWYQWVDEFMDAEQYDSAQFWISHINGQIGNLPNMYFRYLLSSRQAEVYYYNFLPQMGLAESRRSLSIAEVLGDSVLMADAINFQGLFYLSMDSVTKAISCFHKSLKLLPPPPYDSLHRSFSYPFHIMGNIAEAFLKQKQFDSTIHYARQSFVAASAANRDRGKAIAWQMIGDCKLQLQEFDSSIHYLGQGYALSVASNDYDVSLLCAGGLANCFSARSQYDSSRYYLEKGTGLILRFPNLNRLFTNQFLNTAYRLYKNMNDRNGAEESIRKLADVQQQSLLVYNRQLESIVNSSIENEKQVNEFRVGEALYQKKLANSRFIIALVTIALLGIIFWVYAHRQANKQAISELRYKLSKDLHDDLGATLSSLNIYSTIAKTAITTNPEKAEELLDRIQLQSRNVMENMDDIVWSMPLPEQQATSFEARIKNYGTELLAEKDIAVDYSIDPRMNTAIQNIMARRNIWLICKEAFNNIAKYSHASQAKLVSRFANGKIQLVIEDNGVGFDNALPKSGNGLKNIISRCKELQGICSIHSKEQQGTRISISIPETSLK